MKNYAEIINDYFKAEKKISIPEVEEYFIYARDNPEEIDEDIKLLIINIAIPTLLNINKTIFDKEMYYKFITFAEKWYYKLMTYQKFICAFVFMYDLDDIPLFRIFFIIMARGNGKDGLVCPLIHFLSSEYYGVYNYNVDIIANNEEQSHETYDVIYNMLEDNKQIMLKHFYWNKESCTNLKTGSKIRFNTSNGKTKDGKRDGALLFNEFHAYRDYSQIRVFISGLGKRKHPRIFIISSFGEVRDGPFDEYLNISELILHGEENDIKIFPAIYRLNNIDEVDNPNKWILANPSIKYFPELKNELQQKYIDQKRFPSQRAEFLMKNMNIPANGNEELVTSWDNILKASYKDILKKIPRSLPEFNEKKNCIIGIDYASLNDFASVGFLILDNGEYIWRQKSFICKNSQYFSEIKFPFEKIGTAGYEDFEIVDTPTISEDLIIDYILEIMVEYNVLKIILDNYKFQLMKKVFIENGISIEDKANPNGLVRMIRYPASIAAIYGMQIEKVFANGNINIGNSAIMRWFINNTCVKRGKDGNMSYLKIEPRLRKNDGFMAMVCAFSGNDLLEEIVVYI